MKNYLIIIFSLIFFVATSQNKSELNNIIKSHKANFVANKYTHSQIGDTYNQYYLRAIWNINPNQYFINGNVTYYFIMNTTSNVLTFDLHDTLNVDSVIYNNNILTYSRANNVLTITLPNTINEGVNDSISIYYNGEPSKEGGERGSFAINKYEFNGDSIPCMWTLSEPYGAKDWFPCKQELFDKIDSCDLYFITPSKYKTASNGLIISDDTINGKRYTHWQHKRPMAAYLIGFVSTEFRERHRYIHILNNDSIYMMEYFLKNDSSIINTPYNKMADLFNLYDTLFTDYPFKDEKYGHMQWNRAGGMEHQTISSMDGMNWYSHYTIEHEFMHQWFGDYITCGSWHDIWLNEGFAIFGNFISLEYLWTYWDTWYPSLIKSYHDDIIRLPDGSVYVDDTTSVDRIFDGRLTYEQGGFLLRMLRWELGDENFFKGVRAYVNNPDLQNNYARTQDLQNALEQAADTNLTDFFNNWFYGQGYPIYNIEYNQSDDYNVNILVKQTSSHQSVSFYKMTLPIQFWINGNDTIIRLHNTSNNQLFNIQLNNTVDSIIFDPEYKIISENNITQNVNLLTVQNIINIFPNPAKNIININLGNLPININNIYITDMLGKQSNLQFKNSNNQEIDISKFNRGNYIISVITNKFSYNKKIIIL